MSAGKVHREFWDRIVAGKLDEAAALVDPEGSFFSRPIGTVPMDAFVYIMKAVQTAAPMTFSYRTEMVEGDRSVLEMQGHSVFPSGDVYENNYVFIADVRDGLIRHLREYSDTEYANAMFARNIDSKVLERFGAMVATAQG